MFGHRYFGAKYFGPRYWGLTAVPAPDTLLTTSTPGRVWRWRLPNQVKGETEDEKYLRRVAQGIIQPVSSEIYHVDLEDAVDLESIKIAIAEANREIVKAKAKIAAIKNAQDARSIALKLRIEIEEELKQQAEQALEELDVMFVATILSQE